MTNPDKTEPIVRHWPDTTLKWMTYQVGRMATRPEVAPLFLDRAVVGTRTTDHDVSVFHLYGWGKTEDDARRMAHKNGI